MYEQLMTFGFTPDQSKIYIFLLNHKVLSIEDMVSQIENVKKLNEGNKNLLTHAIDLVSGSLRLLNNLMNSNAVYYRNGKIQNKDHSGRVLSGDV